MKGSEGIALLSCLKAERKEMTVSNPYGGASRTSTIDDIERNSLMDRAEFLLTI